MRHRIATLLGLGAVLSAAILWLAAAPMASAGDPCYHGFEVPADTVAATNEVKLMPCAFGPTVTKVDVGSEVTFVNDTSVSGATFAHLITGANNSWGSRDVEIQPGKSVSYTFEEAGLYPYSCALHRGMSGVIVVGDAAAIDAAAVGSTSGTTTGTTTTAGAATPPATSPTAATGTDPLPLVVAAALAGLFVGGLSVWFVGRRRTTREQRAVAPAG